VRKEKDPIDKLKRIATELGIYIYIHIYIYTYIHMYIYTYIDKLKR
jgi:hypothetical protein